MARPFIQFKTIVPKKGVSYDLFKEEIVKSMRDEVKPDLRALFQKTVENWQTRVYFRGTINTSAGNYIRLLVKPYGSGAELYELVARGARPHEIVPRRADYLRFRVGYVPATKVRVIGSRRKQRFGETRFTKHVDHPGFEGRYWDEQIAKDYKFKFKSLMTKAVLRYVRRQATRFSQSQKTENPSPVER